MAEQFATMIHELMGLCVLSPLDENLTFSELKDTLPYRKINHRQPGTVMCDFSKEVRTDDLTLFQLEKAQKMRNNGLYVRDRDVRFELL